MAFQKPKRAPDEIWVDDVPRWGGRLLALVTLHFGTTHTRMSQDWRHFKELFVANKHSGGIPLHVARRPPEWLQNIRCLPVGVWTWPSRSGITAFYTLHSAEKTKMLRQQTATYDAAVDMTIDALKGTDYQTPRRTSAGQYATVVEWGCPFFHEGGGRTALSGCGWQPEQQLRENWRGGEMMSQASFGM